MQELYQRFGGKCAYCNTPTVLYSEPSGTPPDDAATLDHIKPRCRGGKRSRDNVALACFACNNKKGDLPVEVFKFLLDTNAGKREWKEARKKHSITTKQGRRAKAARARAEQEQREEMHRASRRAGKPVHSGKTSVLVASAAPPEGVSPGYFAVLARFEPVERVVIINELRSNPCPGMLPTTCSADSTAAASTAMAPAISTEKRTARAPRLSIVSRFTKAAASLFWRTKAASTGSLSRPGLSG